MRGKPAFIAIVVMALVLAGVWVGTRPRGGGATSVALLRFDPTAVTELRLTREDGFALESVERLAWGRWVVRSGRQDWPVDESVIRGAMRKLLAMRGEPSDQPVEKSATLTVMNEDQPIASLTMGSKRLAGRGLVEVSSNGEVGVYLSDGELLDVFTASGLMPWRERKALPLLGDGATVLTLHNGETSIRMGKVRGRWGLAEPFRERTDEARVNAALRTLANLEFDRFIENDDAPAAGSNTASITVELVRSGESMRQRLVVLGAADIGGEHVFVSVALDRNGEEWAAASGVVAREVLDEIPMDPAWYASRRAVDAVPADVAKIWLSRATASAPAPLLPDPKMQAEVTLERTLDGWSGPNPAAAALYDEMADALLSLVCDVDAEEVGVELPDQYTPIAMIQVGGRDGLPTGIAELGVAQRGDVQVVIVRSGSFNRVYADSRAIGFVETLLGTD